MKIVNWNTLSPLEQKQLLQRSTMNNETLNEQVLTIMNAVKTKGDEALIDLTAQFDKAELTQLQVSDEEFTLAYQKVDKETLAAIRFAIARMKAQALAQRPEDWVFDSEDGIVCQRKARAIETVGLYVPGGTAPLVSSVIMLAIPALVAGCVKRIMCTPPAADGSIAASILVAAKECGIQAIYKIGGAQAIAAMAYGTNTIDKVDKIFGPGNQWVAKAKQLCMLEQSVSIDMPAGPSELLIIADNSAKANFVAADLLSQAEHDKVAQVMLVTTSMELANQVQKKVAEQLACLPRKEIATAALVNSKIILVDTLLEAIALSNDYAPEHLSLQVRDPEQYFEKITNAGTVFVGDWSAEALGDYNTGANHVLPTAGLVKSYSGLSVLDFMKWVGFQQVTQAGVLHIGKKAAQLAKLEALQAHENAILIRLNEVTAKCAI